MLFFDVDSQKLLAKVPNTFSLLYITEQAILPNKSEGSKCFLFAYKSFLKWFELDLQQMQEYKDKE